MELEGGPAPPHPRTLRLPPPGRGALRGRRTEKGRLVWAPPMLEGAPRRRYHQCLLRGGAAGPLTPPPLGRELTQVLAYQGSTYICSVRQAKKSGWLYSMLAF